MRNQTKPIVGLLVALTASVLLIGCGKVGSTGDVKLGVPFHQQDPNSFDCGPASVQMWADYDLPGTPPSQQAIATYMGGTTCGASEDAIAAAVNYFTGTSDAYWDVDSYLDPADFMSRQITSIDNYTPVIAIIDFNHAGVVNGGKWHELSDGYEWDYTYFHDPQEFRGDHYYGSGQWIDANCPASQACSQIISSGASGSWAYNQSLYGDSVYTNEGCGSGGCNQEYQN